MILWLNLRPFIVETANFYVPVTLSAGRLPLIVDLHGEFFIKLLADIETTPLGPRSLVMAKVAVPLVLCLTRLRKLATLVTAIAWALEDGPLLEKGMVFAALV